MGKLFRWDWITFTSIFTLLRRHYPFLVIAGILVHKFTLKNIVVTILAFLICHFLLNFAQHYKALQQFWLMYKDFLTTKGSAVIRSYRPSDYFDPHLIDSFFKKFAINPYLLIFHKNIDEAVRIIDSRTLGPEIIADVVCISRPMFKSYILIRQAPTDEQSPIQRLIIAHEIGHFALSPLFLTARRTGGLFLTGLLFFFITNFVDFNLMPIWLIIFYTLLFFIRVFNWTILWLPTSLRDEMYADLFALYLLSPEERKAIWERFTSPRYKPASFFRNSKIIASYTNRRTAMFMKNLQTTAEGNATDYIESTIRSIEDPIIIQFGLNLFWCSVYFSLGFFLHHSLVLNFWPWCIAAVITLFITALFQFFNSCADDYLSIKMETSPSKNS